MCADNSMIAAKSIQKMLSDGIDTWAPNLCIKKAVVDFSSRNIAEEVDISHLRSTIIGDTLVRMLEFSKVDVIRRNRLGDRYGMLTDFLFEKLSNDQLNNHLARGEIPFGRFLEYLFQRVPNAPHTIGELEVFYEEWKKRFNEDAKFRNIAYQAQVLYQGSDERYLDAWAQICKIDRNAYQNVYQRLGVHMEEEIKSSCDRNVSAILDSLRKTEGLIEISKGKQVIFVEQKHPILSDFWQTKKIPLTVVKKDGSCDFSLTDLADLWYEVNEAKAECIIYVADLGKEGYIQMCITAARRAGWLPTDEDKYPRTTFVGYGIVEGASAKMVDLLEEAKTRCKAALVEQGKAVEWTVEELENTAEALGYGAVKYSNLKTNRLTNYTFRLDEMLNDKGNTAIYLLYTQAQICSIMRKSGKDIDQLKKAGKLILETDEKRELGLHLLRFSEVVAEVCLALMPHILCQYLYDLSEKFNSFYSSSVYQQKVIGSTEETSNLSEKFTSSCSISSLSKPVKNRKMKKRSRRLQTTSSEVDDRAGHPTTSSVMRKCSYKATALDTGIARSSEETSNLLLCEATAVVMRKCFHLLGITLIYKI